MDTTDGIYAGKGFSCLNTIFLCRRCGVRFGHREWEKKRTGTRKETIKSSEERQNRVREERKCRRGRMGGHRGVKED